jgi:hypothetical protein
MKKTLIIACTAALFAAVSANAQVDVQEDTTSYTNERMKDAGDELQEADRDEDTPLKTGNEMSESPGETGEAAKADEKVDTTSDAGLGTGDQTKSTIDTSRTKTKKSGKFGAAEIKSEKLESKVGPNGEPIFVDEHAQYYYIDHNGQRVNIDKSELKDKTY